MDDDSVTWFAVTSGRFTGFLGLVAAAIVGVIGVFDGAPAGVVAGLLLALLSWVVLLRPRVGTRGSDLLLRGMVSTVVIPLASIESLVVRQVLSIGVGGRRYVSGAVGHAMRDLHRTRRAVDKMAFGTGQQEIPPAQDKYADQVGEMITERSRAARRDGAPMGPARRDWAWLEIGGLGVLLVALVVTLLI
ncbi:hypothetical protein SAMN04487968_110136 [Nocardioides terrae]|uniref:PH domain-containing protein n=1 Tax=Nocardioides terrae TaxID=574651 RepID=A0A1I1LVF8_9ACTN|nr:hypothetical protein [Nocardioides terrae]SFC74303.1 hypothetical protein SAMN04487968_110136 [Nocardioides terrae]